MGMGHGERIPSPRPVTVRRGEVEDVVAGIVWIVVEQCKRPTLRPPL